MGMNKKLIKSFTGLIAWQKGHQLVLKIYKTTSDFPKRETYSLIDQMRRASVSITSNLAEGFSRRTQKEKCQFYYTALGSELENQLLVARDVGYLKEEILKNIAGSAIEVAKLINGLIKSVKNA